MKTGFVLFCVVCAAVSALSSAEEGSPEYQPAVTVGPAAEFSPEPPATTTAATTTAATTTAATTTAATTTAATTTAATTTAATTTAATTTAATTTAATTTAATTTAATTTAATTTAATTTAATTTAATTTAATTTAATTTAAPTTAATTTAAPTTAAPTTAAPTTAPPKPTTPTPGPTTPATSPTTAAPPTPTQPTNLTAGNYNVTDAVTGATCLLCQVAVQIRRQTDAKTSFPFTVVPGDTKASGSCTADKATLTLSFKEGAITLTFNRNKADNDVYVDSVAFNLSYPLGNASAFSQSVSSLHLFNAAIGHSYSCKMDSVSMGNTLFLDVTHTRMQAFNLTQAKEFGTPDMCATDRPDYRVAIAVGVTLLVLIVIVVIVYLIGRRHRTSGYQTL